jgi:hypothetical protein
MNARPSAIAWCWRKMSRESPSPARRALWTAQGIALTISAVLRGMVRPVRALAQNRSNDYTGANGTVHWLVDDRVLDGWNGARKQLGVSLNSLLTAALFLANRRWHEALGISVGRVNGTLVMETRPRDGSFRSFANHLATLEVELPLDRVEDLGELARQVQAQVQAQRDSQRPIKRFLGERVFVQGMTVAQMQQLIFESERPAFNLNFSNLIALDFPSLGGEGWTVDEVLITTPVGPRTGIVLTAIRYRGRLCFNFNYKESAVARAEVERLCGAFQAVLGELGSAEANG